MIPGRILDFSNTLILFEEKNLLSTFVLMLKIIAQVVGSRGEMQKSLLCRTLRAWTWSNAFPVDLARAWNVEDTVTIFFIYHLVASNMNKQS